MEESPEPFRGYNSMCRRVGRRYAQCWFDNYEIGSVADSKKWQHTSAGNRETVCAIQQFRPKRNKKQQPKVGMRNVCGCVKRNRHSATGRVAVSVCSYADWHFRSESFQRNGLRDVE